MTLKDYLLEYRVKNYNPDEVNIDDFATEEIKAADRKKLERDLAITLLGGYKCKYCGKEFDESSELDLHHGYKKFSEMKKKDDDLKRHETPWHVINQTEFGRGISILCPKCHRKTTAQENSKKEDEAKKIEVMLYSGKKIKVGKQGEFFEKKDINKYHKMSEKRINKKEEIAKLFEKVLTKKDYDDFIEKAHEKNSFTKFREIMNNYIISFIRNKPEEFSKLISRKKAEFVTKREKMDFEDLVKKIRNTMAYYNPK